MDAAHIAKKLVKIFAQVSISDEILTDQGTNFTS